MAKAVAAMATDFSKVTQARTGPESPAVAETWPGSGAPKEVAKLGELLLLIREANNLFLRAANKNSAGERRGGGMQAYCGWHS